MTTGFRDSYERAVARLEEAVGEPESAMNRDATIQRFEFCFELGWKVIQKALRTEGIDRASPRSCLQEAWRLEWIEEEPWLAMLADRNLTAHTYDETLAREVYARIRTYAPMFRKLLSSIPG